MSRYAAPSAPLEAATSTARPVKPLAVWITQILGCAYAVLPIVTIYQAVRAFLALRSQRAFAWTAVWAFGLALLIVALLVVMVIHLQRRSQVGRWLAVLFVSLVLLMLILTPTTTLPPVDGYMNRYAAYFSTLGIVGVLVVWWLYAIGFSRKARTWFTKTAHPADPSAPR